jgi:hypothetical protein
MKDIYANCYAIIAADDLPNVHGGCFTLVDGLNWASYLVDSFGLSLSRVKANVRLTYLREPFYIKVCYRIKEHTAPKTLRSLLNQRGWTLQERVLAL